MDRGLASDAGQDEVARDLREFGETDAAARYERQALAIADAHFPVEPENWEAVEAFRLLSSQFRNGGFRYEGVQAGLSMAGMDQNKMHTLFPKLRLLEAGARERLAEEQNKS